MVNLQQLTGEEKILQARFQDAVNAARLKNQIKFVGFLDLRAQQIMKAVAQANSFSSWQLYGGFEGAEAFFRTILTAPKIKAFCFPLRRLPPAFGNKTSSVIGIFLAL